MAFVVLSFLLTHRFEFIEINNKIYFYFIIFIISLLPSYYNIITDIPEALPLSLHLLFFVMIFSIVGLHISDYKQIRYFLILFLTVSILNGLYVIFIALLTGNRVFGFSGIMYVDYVGYSIIISFLYLMINKSRRLLILFAFSTFSLALIFTQTRSIWLVTGVTLLLIFIHLFIKNKRYNISRLKISLAFVFVVATILVFTFIIRDVNKGYFERVEIKKMEQTDDPMRQTLQINSLVTRYFIWSIAWDAFISSPIIGVGIYGFPFISEKYSTLDPFLYETFVEELTPHETFLAILTESGIFGFIGFMLFLTTTIWYSIKNYRNSKSDQELFYSEIILWLTVYTFFSMIITDAWLWGHGIILWGFLLGMSIANRKMLNLNRMQIN
ncbi:MAG TPA: O-antigen ligase family protein [Ignavibacteriaceae bacterium]|nr:O-antigen ligase family protein [Ignavibacteriaceae bacterium]